MEYTIQELLALHRISKPEIKKAVAITNGILETEFMTFRTRMTLETWMQSCKSYDEVIDALFAEIDRLNGMQGNEQLIRISNFKNGLSFTTILHSTHTDYDRFIDEVYQHAQPKNSAPSPVNDCRNIASFIASML